MHSEPPPSVHQFLKIGRFHRNERSAERLVLTHLNAKFPDHSKNALRKSKFTFQHPPKRPFERTFEEMKREAREKGTVSHLLHFAYGPDPYFPSTLGIATNSAGFKIKSEYAGHVVEFSGPMRVTAVEDEPSEDILWYRRSACEASASSSFTMCTRYYRAYVLACTSMVEAVLNRPVLLLSPLRQHLDVVEKLHRPLPFDERIDLWVRTFCRDPLGELKQTTSWGHFQELREERNLLVHSTRPQLGIEIRSLERGFNSVREGAGGSMRRLRKM